MKLISVFIVFLLSFNSIAANSEEIDFMKEIKQSIDSKALKEVVETLSPFKITTLSISQKPYDHKVIKEWYHNMVTLNQITFNYLTDFEGYENSVATRLSINIVNQIVSYWLGRGTYTLMHEVAHAESITDFGGEDITFYVGDTPYKNMGEFYLAFLKGYNRGAVGYFLPLGTTRDEVKKDAVVSASGINSQIMFSEELALKALDNGVFNHTDANYYITNKIISSVYYYYDPDSNVSDIHHYVESLYGQGFIGLSEYSDTKKSISQYTLLATLLSGRTWEALGSIFREIYDGEGYVGTLGFETPFGFVSSPEFNVYLNADNVSLKSMLHITASTAVSVFGSYETTLIGQELNEYSLGIKLNVDEWEARIIGRYNDQGDSAIEVEVEYDIGQKDGFSLIGGLKFDTGTQENRRENYLQNSEVINDFEFFVGAEYKFGN